MSDIFISYASSDRERAKTLAEALVQKGWSVWWDRKILAGKVFDDVIEEALDAAKCVIVLWSKESAKSDWVKTEAAEGKRREILVPALVDDVKIPLVFRRIQAAWLVDWKDTSPHPGFDRLLEAVSSILGETPPAKPLPTKRVELELPKEKKIRLRKQPSQPVKTKLPRKKTGLPIWVWGFGGAILLWAAMLIVWWRFPEMFNSPDRPVSELSEKIEEPGKKQKITELQKKAREHIAADRLSSPEGTNALEVIEEILSIDPGNEDVKKLEKQIAERYESLGDASRGKGDYGKAIGYYQKSIEINPTATGVQSKLVEARRKGREKPSASKEITIGGIEFVLVKGGTFQMGDQFGDGESDELPIHTVQVNGFYMSKYEITFDQYDGFCEATGRSKLDDEDWGRGRRPVINVNWEDAVAFCEWISKRTGGTVRLPTEAEWEYAARVRGKKVRFGNGRNVADPTEINFNGSAYKENYSVEGKYRAKTMPVGSFNPNGLGLYDMSGNVWEWCQDGYDADYYKNSPEDNPKGPSTGYAVARGGSWSDVPISLRCSNRYYDYFPRYEFVGFRVVRTF